MISQRVGALLMSARRQVGLSRTELARRAGVSTRLLAELERGERPNVSLESALVLLQSVGVTMRLTDPAGNVVDTGDELTADMQRAIRAVRRRATWTGRRVHQHEAGEPPAPPRSGVGRLAEVTRVSASAFALARRGSAAR